MGGGRHGERWALMAAAVFFLLFLGNVLLGKLAASRGVLDAWQAGNVIEALFLFFAVVAFVVAAIQRESREAAESGRAGSHDANSVGGNNGST